MPPKWVTVTVLVWVVTGVALLLFMSLTMH